MVCMVSQVQYMLHDCLRGIEKLLSQSLTRIHDKVLCQKGQDGYHSNYDSQSSFLDNQIEISL